MRSTNHFLAVIFSVFSFLSPNPVEIINAVSQEQVSNSPDFEKVINYNIQVIAKKPSKKLHFGIIFSNDEAIETTLYDNSNHLIENFKKNDTIRIHASLPIKEENSYASPSIYLHYSFKEKHNAINMFTNNGSSTNNH